MGKGAINLTCVCACFIFLYATFFSLECKLCVGVNVFGLFYLCVEMCGNVWEWCVKCAASSSISSVLCSVSVIRFLFSPVDFYNGASRGDSHCDYFGSNVRSVVLHCYLEVLS